jgi:hypothetical protein
MTNPSLPAIVETPGSDRTEVVAAAAEAAPVVTQATSVDPRIEPRSDVGFSQAILNAGFIFGLVLAGLALVMTGIYLVSFLVSTDSSLERLFESASKSSLSQPTFRLSITARMILVKLVLLSCGIFVGLAFGFLGFSLFLLGIRGDMDVDARSKSYRVRITRMYPGVFVILCATALVAICVMSKVDFAFDSTAGEGEGQTDGAAALDAAAKEAVAKTNERRFKKLLDEDRPQAKPAGGP